MPKHFFKLVRFRFPNIGSVYKLWNNVKNRNKLGKSFQKKTIVAFTDSRVFIIKSEATGL